MLVRALRGATTLESDTKEQMFERVPALLAEMLQANQITPADVISVLFTATGDIHCAFPATAARTVGFGDVPLICATELDIDNATPLCVRVMMQIQTERAREDLHHIYLEGAKNLRDLLPE